MRRYYMDIRANSLAGLPSGIIYGNDGDQTPNAALFKQWDDWAKQANNGGAEQRDKAVMKLKDCLERGSTYLNLNCLNLASLPANLPPDVVTLKASGNAFTTLPAALPTGLHELDVDNSPLESLVDPFPPELKSLYLSGTRLSMLPDDLPAGLVGLHLDDAPLD